MKKFTVLTTAIQSVVVAALFIISSFASAQNIIPCVGVDADNEGVFAWNVTGTKVGHDIPAPYDNFGNDVAYYYFSSRNVADYDPQSTTGMHGTGNFTGFASFSAALTAAGKSIGDVNVQVGGPNLGNDIENQDWNFVGPIESRFYGGGQYAILINSDTILLGQSGISTLVIDYNTTTTPLDDEMTGYSDYSIPVNVAKDSLGIALAAAFLNDIGQYGINMNFLSVQRAGQTEYVNGNIKGAFFELQQANIKSGGLLIPNLGKDIMLCTGDSTVLDAGAGRDGYLWNTGDTTQTLTVTQSGSYFVTIDSSNVKGISAPITVTVSTCTNYAEITNEETELYPNPFNTQLNNPSGALLSLFDVSGNVVMVSKEKVINTAGLAAGTYFVKDSEGQVVKTLLKQ